MFFLFINAVFFTVIGLVLSDCIAYGLASMAIGTCLFLANTVFGFISAGQLFCIF